LISPAGTNYPPPPSWWAIPASNEQTDEALMVGIAPKSTDAKSAAEFRVADLKSRQVANATSDTSAEAIARDAAISNRLTRGEQPGSTVPWKQFCDSVRDDCDGWADRKQKRPKRGFGDRTIKRVAGTRRT
jgi:hypothetical protein